MIYSKARVFAKVLDPIKKRIQLMLGRAVLEAVNDEQGIQLLKMRLLKGESRTDIEHLFDYGYTSHAPDGSEALCGFIGGNRNRGFAIKVDNREFRFKPMAKGEVAIYTDEGDRVHFKRDRIMDVICGNELNAEVTNKVKVSTKVAELNATTSVTITSPITKCDGNFEVTGTSLLTGLVTAPAGVTAVGGLSAAGAPSASQITDQKGTMEQMRQTYNSHTHPENGDGGGTTSGPNQPMN